jgi:hypothetical protein
MCERIPKDKFIYATINVGSVGSNPWNNHIISIDVNIIINIEKENN